MIYCLLITSSTHISVWWAATLITTINSSYSVQTFEGRILGLLLRVFALGATGYLTAVLAAYLVGQQREPKREARRNEDELARIRAEIADMRALLQQLLETQGSPTENGLVASGAARHAEPSQGR